MKGLTIFAIFVLAASMLLFSCGQETKSLKEEIKMLKEENAFLKAENVGLKKEIEELYKKLEGQGAARIFPEDKKLGK
jgi:regulator of replication initiation timing